MTKLALILAALALTSLPAVAAPLPAICTADAPMAGHEPGGGGGMEMAAPAGDQAHQDLMAGMDRMNADMMAGGTAGDIDVAFVCSMIPHHQGAIDMAKAELAHGDDPWAREMAQKVIDAQEQEIADMLDWLSNQPQ
jgi:uncharacterized protein (DUF305 family)